MKGRSMTILSAYVSLKNLLTQKAGSFNEWTIIQKVFAIGGITIFTGIIGALIAKGTAMVTTINGW